MRILARFRLFALLAAMTMALLSVPAAAAASKTIAPPGNSGVSQYLEVVPGAGGSVPLGASGSHGPVLSAAQRRRLEASGSSGKALVAFAQRTGVPQAKHAPSGAGAYRLAGAGEHRGSLPRAALASASVRSTAGKGGGLGWGLFAALGAILLAGVCSLLIRRRPRV